MQGGLAQGSPGQFTATGTAGPPGAGTTVDHGTTVSVDTSGMGPVETALAGTAWTREDVELLLNVLSTLILLGWAVQEARR